MKQRQKHTIDIVKLRTISDEYKTKKKQLIAMSRSPDYDKQNEIVARMLEILRMVPLSVINKNTTLND